jgi:hypothetical protein
LSSRPQRRPLACARRSATSSSASSTPLRYEKFVQAWLGPGSGGPGENMSPSANNVRSNTSQPECGVPYVPYSFICGQIRWIFIIPYSTLR